MHGCRKGYIYSLLVGGWNFTVLKDNLQYLLNFRPHTLQLNNSPIMYAAYLPSLLMQYFVNTMQYLCKRKIYTQPHRRISKIQCYMKKKQAAEQYTQHEPSYFLNSRTKLWIYILFMFMHMQIQKKCKERFALSW